MKINVHELQNDKNKISFEIVIEKKFSKKLIAKIHNLLNGKDDNIDEKVIEFSKIFINGVAVYNDVLLNEYKLFFNVENVDIKEIYRKLNNNGVKFKRSNSNGSRKITFIC